MKLRYTKKAARELAEILDYIALHSPRGETLVSRRLHDMIDLLVQFPAAGQVTTKASIRWLIVTPYPYLIFYKVTEDAVVVHGVRHMARRPS